MAMIRNTISLLLILLATTCVVECARHRRAKSHKAKNSKGKKKAKGNGRDFQPNGSYRCTHIKCVHGLETYTESEYMSETHHWTYIEDDIYNVVADDNTDPMYEMYMQQFSMVQYPHDESVFEGIVWDRHQPFLDPPYCSSTGGYSRDFKPMPDGGGIPDMWYTPPIASFKAFFVDEHSYMAYGHFQKPGGVHVCDYQMCERIS